MVGVGGTFGLDFVEDPSVDQTFEQANVRINYQATGKLGLSASAGVEFRQFDNHRGDRVTPVFELGAIYRPFDGTTVTLTAGRRISILDFLPIKISRQHMWWAECSSVCSGVFTSVWQSGMRIRIISPRPME